MGTTSSLSSMKVTDEAFSDLTIFDDAMIGGKSTWKWLAGTARFTVYVGNLSVDGGVQKQVVVCMCCNR